MSAAMPTKISFNFCFVRTSRAEIIGFFATLKLSVIGQRGFTSVNFETAWTFEGAHQVC